MNKTQLTKYFKQQGENWLAGSDLEGWEFSDKKILFLPKQKEFINERDKTFICAGGGIAGGKSLSLCIKIIMLSLFFEGNVILLGRKYLSDLLKSTLGELLELIPYQWYSFNKKDNIITFFNGSKILLFSLDSLTEGSQEDRAKALASLRGTNLGAFAVEELHQISYQVWDTLCSRLRKSEVPLRFGLATTNPSNYWGLSFFKLNSQKRDDIKLIEFSTYDNPFLPASYVKEREAQGEDYKKRWLLGEWSMDLLLKSTIFAPEHIKRLETMIKEPISFEEGFAIWEQPQTKKTFQIGVDPSEGVVDPSSISVISSDGIKVAKFNGKIPIPALIEKTRFIYNKYTTTRSPLIIPEVNSSGQALLLGISDLNIYRRTMLDTDSWGRKETQKLGWKTSYQTKQALISNFQDLLRKDLVRIYDKQMIEEMKTFIWSDSAKQSGAGSERGFHDDDVISTLLGFWDLQVRKPKTMLEKVLEEGRQEAKRRRLIKKRSCI